MSNEEKIELVRLSNIKGFLIELIIAILVVALFKIFVFDFIYVKGDSMNPTLINGDRLILKKFESSLGMEKYKRGDIIVFKSPLKMDDGRLIKKSFIKRVIGLPGDKVEVINGEVFLNDQLLEEIYIDKDSYTDSVELSDPVYINDGELFVMGDNRKSGASVDSRKFGKIAMSEVKGSFMYRVFPLSRIGGNL